MVPLVGGDTAVHLKQKCQRMLLQLQRLAGSERVEQVDDEQTEIALQPLHIGVSAMQHLDNGRVCENRLQQMQRIVKFESVHDVIA